MSSWFLMWPWPLIVWTLYVQRELDSLWDGFPEVVEAVLREAT